MVFRDLVGRLAILPSPKAAAKVSFDVLRHVFGSTRVMQLAITERAYLVVHASFSCEQIAVAMTTLVWNPFDSNWEAVHAFSQ